MPGRFNGGGDTRVRPENTRGQLDDPVELLVFDHYAPDFLVRRRGTVQDAVGDDDCRSTSGLEQLQK
jgi:hypothetical protein